MRIWLMHDLDPDGGHLSAQEWEVDLSLERPTIDEVRIVEIERDLWDWFMQGNLPINEDDIVNLDHVWQPWWDEARVVWTRPKGSV